MAVESLGVRRALLRTGLVFAADGGALPRMALPFRLFAGGLMGSGRQVVPWIHLADEAAAICFLAECDDARGPFNFAAPQSRDQHRVEPGDRPHLHAPTSSECRRSF